MKKAVIFDIDHTLCIFDKKRNDIQDAMENAIPIKGMKDLVCVIQEGILQAVGGGTIIFVSGRPERYRKETIRWIESYIADFLDEDESLILREDDEFSSDEEMKDRALNKIKKRYEVICAFDDKESVLEMYHRNGVTCFKPFQ